MLISYSHNFYFLKSPKVAGTTTECVLGQLCQGENDVYTTFNKSEIIDKDNRKGNYKNFAYNNENKRSEYNEHLNYNKASKLFDLKNLRPIVNIRHPYEICASECAWNDIGMNEYIQNKSVKEKSDEYIRNKFDKRFYEPLQNGFSIFNIKKHYLHIYRLYEFHQKSLDNPNLYVIRFDHLDEDLGALCKEYGIIKDIPHTKKTRSFKAEEVANILTRKQLNLINEFFANDFEFWNWSKY